MSVMRSLATLAYSGSRKKYAYEQMVAAFKILKSGIVTPDNFDGSWAAAMGHTQFIPSSYISYAVDWTGDGKKDIWNTYQDALASTANYLKGYGWKRGQGWEPDEPNFPVIKEWNKANVYSRTIAHFATRLAEGRGLY
jgi:membrane-bound lytic murein transglycosylase B